MPDFCVGAQALITDNHGYTQLVTLEECLDPDDQLFFVRFADGSNTWAAPLPDWGDLRPAAPEYEI